jgi:poly-gamma-glutamate synthesis protein (capsule biosynthesis protein)
MDCGMYSCGYESFFETLGHLNRVGIETIGAGINLEDALQPVVLEVQGIRFGFVSLGEVNEKVFASKDTPGIGYLSMENLRISIERAKEISDVVIVLPHSGPEDYPEVTPNQKFWARNSVAFGANLVVTTHAHILQGYQMMEDTPVFYSLGNFVFDQSWARDHQQGAILIVTFEGDKLLSFEIVPTIVVQNGTVNLADGGEKEEILERLELLSQELVEGK